MSHGTSYGGQALIEGVMIRGAGSMSVACRRPNGRIVVRTQTLAGAATDGSRRVPLVRGMIALGETLVLGMRALTFSAAVANEPKDADEEGCEIPETVAWGSIVLAIGFAAALFFASPILMAHGLSALGLGRVGAAVVEAVVRIGMFLGYVAVIGLIPGIRRVFQYHGAEHMTVHAHEAGMAISPESVRAYRKEHPRCGTSFLLVVMTVAVLSFFVFDLIAEEGLLARVTSRVVMIPLIAAVAYELLRLGARYQHLRVVRWLFTPNILLQKLTTRVPDDDQIEVAIVSLNAILAHDAALVGSGASADVVLAPAES